MFAHRGLAVSHPENSLAAFAAAIETGATHIETDTRLSADGVAVLYHDPTFMRDGREIAVSDLTAAALADPATGPGFAVPTLAETLAAFPSAFFNIDVKEAAVEAAAIAAIRDAGAADRVLIASFDDQRRTRVSRALPGSVSSPGELRMVGIILASALRLTPVAARMFRGVSALQIPERHRGIPVLTRQVIAQAHRHGVEVHVWTVNDPTRMRQLVEMGVDGIITDRADLAVSELRL